MTAAKSLNLRGRTLAHGLPARGPMRSGLRAWADDLRHGVRAVARAPMFATGAVLTLALGIGAATAMFTVVNALLIRPLPYAEPERLVRITADLEGRQARDVGLAVPVLFDLAQRGDVFAAVSGLYPINANLSGTDEPERIEAQLVSVNYFALLGVRAQLGRVFDAGDYHPGIAERAVISDSLWVRRFGRDPRVLGRRIRLDNDLYEIVGVLPASFEHPGRGIAGRTELWAPTGYRATPFPEPSRQFALLAGGIARLQPGVSLRQAQAALDLYTRDVTRAYPDQYTPALGWRARVVPLRDDLVGETRPALAILTGAVALVLLIACANVANLLLARAASRQRELAIRRALGASGGRLVAQLCAESLVLALAAGVLALLFTMWTVDALAALIPSAATPVSGVAVDARVAAFAVLLAMASVALFGLAPAVRAVQPDAQRALRDGAVQATASRAHQRARTVLAAAQCALALILLVGAMLLVRTFQKLDAVDLGFEPEGVLTLRIWMPQPNEPSTGPYFRHEQRLPFYRAVADRVRALPSVETVGWTTRLPLTGRFGQASFAIEGRPLEERNVTTAQGYGADAAYFDALGIAIHNGRAFAESDTPQSPPVVIVNETFARRYFPEGDALGRRIRPGAAPSSAPWRTIVGIVDDVRIDGVDATPQPQVYVSMTQFSSLSVAMVVKTRGGDPAALGEAIRSEVRRVDPDMPVFGIQPMTAIVEASMGQRRFAATLLLAFAGFALLLACVGVYAVIAYVVAQRTHEFGIRLALGAQESHVVRIVLAHGARIAAAGTIVGLAGALLLTRGLRTLLFEVSPTDATTFAIVPTVLAAVCVLACYIPARRAMNVSPVVALRRD